jgi:hypothetical protein
MVVALIGAVALGVLYVFAPYMPEEARLRLHRLAFAGLIFASLLVIAVGIWAYRLSPEPNPFAKYLQPPYRKSGAMSDLPPGFVLDKPPASPDAPPRFDPSKPFTIISADCVRHEFPGGPTKASLIG